MEKFKLVKLNNPYELKTEEECYFQEFNVSASVLLPCERIRTNDIKTAVADIRLLDAKCIVTAMGTSLEGQHLTGKKINIIGTVELEVIYNCTQMCKKLCYSQDKIPFSTFIVVPMDICEKDILYIEYYIEDIEAVVIACGKLFVNIAVYMAYRDQY
ncbi:MAG: DUF3794 domain-containing protein [Cellulosilyticaceae bacterium]